MAVFLEDAGAPPDLASLEERLEAAVNGERERRGLAPLVRSEPLRAIARAHSEDMVSRGFFDHTSPGGASTAGRVRGAGLRFARVSENIARSLNVDDPVRTTVEGWLESPGHRRNMLDPAVVETGAGAAVETMGFLPRDRSILLVGALNSPHHGTAVLARSLLDVDAGGRGVLVARWRIVAPGGERTLKAGESRLARIK